MLKLFQKSDFEVLKEIGDSISSKRKIRSISQVALADAIGINVSTIKALEKGEGCHLKKFIKVLKYLDLEEKLLDAIHVEKIDSPKKRFNKEMKKSIKSLDNDKSTDK